jgi:hypothetical protein
MIQIFLTYVEEGLFFRGTGVLPFDEKILPVKELMIWL